MTDRAYWGGYCHHGNVLFPVWHRAYCFAIEDALRSIKGNLPSSPPPLPLSHSLTSGPFLFFILLQRVRRCYLTVLGPNERLGAKKWHTLVYNGEGIQI